MEAVNAAPWFKELLADHTPPCISIYLPLTRINAPINQTPVHLQNLLNEVREMMGGGQKKGYGAEHARAALGQLERMLNDAGLWDGDRDAVAIFACADHAHVIELRQPVQRLVMIADTFHVKPLIRLMQLDRRYRVLCISPQRVRIFEGDAYGLREATPHPSVPHGVDDLIATESTGNDTTPQGTPAPLVGQPSSPQGNVNVERFFRLVDQAVWERYTRRDRLPIIVAADVKHLATFQGVARAAHGYVEEGIPLGPEAATPQRLRDQAGNILGPQFEQQMNTLKDAYQAAKARHLGSDEIPQVAEAAACGRVGTLLVDSDVKIPGILHRDGLIEAATTSNGRADDLLDDLAEMVLKMDGQVFVLPHQQMPTDHGVAAVYRY
ncbi:MAG TPA: hypothetical protein VH475_25270 [Tepidisphaeraceae bacterium]|jgi:hypothetical protein